MPTVKEVDTRSRVLHWKRRGWSAVKIAARLGITKSSVYYHLHRLEADGEIENAIKVYRRRSV